MAKWEHLIIRIPTKNGDSIVRATCKNGIGIVKMKEQSVYSVTHLKTGLKITELKGSRTQVLWVSDAISKLTDWEKINENTPSKELQRVMEQIKAICTFGPSDAMMGAA